MTLLNLPGYRRSARDLIERLEVSAEDTALDVGCGTGLLTLPLAEQTQRTVGLDLSPAMLEKLTAKAAQRELNVELRQGSALELPFADEEFTVVTTAFMLLYLPHIFERIYRVDKSRSRAGGGSGIGLTIARHLVEAHGGRIWAESAGPGQGTSFSFTLPLAA